MKSKITKIQIFKKGIAIVLSAMFFITPITYAATTIDNSYLESSLLDQLLYGTAGSTVKEIEEYLESHATLYIQNETQLRAFAEYVNNGNNCFEKEIILLNDIHVNPNEEWVPIARQGAGKFNGTFDGQGYTISGITYLKEGKTYDDLMYIGLFGNIDANGIVKNIVIDESNINILYEEHEKSEVSGKILYNGAGYIAGSSSGIIENCINKSDIYGCAAVAGIVGMNLGGTVRNCINEGYVVGDGVIGGIVGRSIDNSKEINCGNFGIVEGNTYVGGIVGLKYGSVINCINQGTIKGGSLTGGIIGDITSENTMEGCIDYSLLSDGESGKIISLDNGSNIKQSYKITDTITEEEAQSIITENFSANYKYDSTSGRIVFNDSQVVGTTIETTSVKFEILKNGEVISTNEYFKAGDVIKVIASFDKYLAKIFGPLTPITEAPVLKINNEIEMEAGTVNAKESNYTTTIDYTYTIKEGDNFNVESLVLSNIKDVYGVDGNDWDSEHSTYTEPDVINIENKSISCSGIIVDTTAPIINTEIYVENALETKRYTVGKEILFEVTTSERIEGDYDRPEILVSFSESGIGKYNYSEEKGTVGYAKCIDAKINMDGTTTWTYSYQIQEGDEGYIQLSYTSGKIADIAENETDLATLPLEQKEIYADTTLPTVEIIEKDVINSITNKNKIVYEFKWSEELAKASEEIEGFSAEKVTVNNGEKGALSEVTKNEDGTYSYTMEITTSIEDGSVGDLQVIIEQDACKDLVGQGNVRTESVIRVDKKAPMLQTLEAYAESGIKLNSEIDVVKEYYKTGEQITVVATFDENITAEKVPELVLQFSESGNSVIPEGIIDSNKIIYTYTIAEGDEGTVSVRAFNGTVLDAAGNQTKVVRKSLDGNTIIVDTKVPSLNELNVTTPSGTYSVNSNKTITIEAIYDENVYAVKDNEIKNISLDTAPTLKVKFGNGEEREATFAGYAGEDKTKLIYTTTIIEADNGELSIVSYENEENIEICDIAGNRAELNNKQTGNEIIADNIRPEVENITAVVENPTISNTDIYYKEGNNIKITLTFSEEVSSKVLFPKIQIGFSEEKDVEPTEYSDYAYESDWNVNSTTIEYSYTIRENDNGYLWVKVPENQFKDIAGNGNVAKEAEEKSNVFADTIIPTVTLYRDTEETQNNQTITIKATFNENVYDLNSDRRVTLTTANAPKLIYSFGDGANREIGATSISGAIITYTIQKDPVEDNGELNYELAKGNLCDRAGNELYTTTLDTTAPVLESVVITSNAGIYAPYCKEGREIYVIATFNEPIKAENMKLKAKVGEVEIAELLDGEIVEENETKVKFTYTVKAGDMGEFTILDICGETDNKITEENADNTYGWVKDEHGNQNNIYSLQDEKVTPTGKAEADTKDPYITSIKAKVDGEEIATYTKEEAKDAVINVGRTNENIVEYIVTYNEKVNILDKSKISIENGIIKSIEYTDLIALNEYKITVQTTVEGVQSLIINEATVEDKAGNTDEFVRLNAVTVDFTKPTVRFISEYNGGVYVLPTNIDKVEIRPNVEISEDIAKIEYKWDNGEYIEIQNYSSSSDIAIPTKAFTEAGTHVLHIRVVDLAGNDYETSKKYEVVNSNIDIELSTYEYTRENIIVTVTFDAGATEDKYKVLTDNRKVTFKAEGSNETVELNAIGTDEDGNTQYEIEENGTIYAEATDRVGNKVFTEHPITNIDNDAPEITFDEYYLNTLVNKEIEVGISLNESAKISYSWDNETWEETNEYVSFLDLSKTFTEVGKYTLYVKAIDKAGNESTDDLEIEVVNLSFEVLGNATEWTSNDVELYVYCEEELASITVNGENVNTEERIYHATANGEYEFVVTDKYGNAAIAVDNKGNVIEGNKILVDKIDKEGPTIEKTDVNSKEITITAEDDKSGLNEYAITKSTEEPVEWSTSNIIKVTEDGTFYVWVKDNVGNITVSESPIVVDTIVLELEITGNVTDWTNQNVELVVKANKALSSLKMGETQIDLANPKVVIEENGDYEFVATDLNGNEIKETVKVTRIDKTVPEISEVTNVGKDITITATDEISGVKEYAITDTTEVPVEWSESNVIKVTEDGIFYAWVKDNAGNVYGAENAIVVDTTAPTVTFNYLSQTVTVGMPVEANVVTNEDAIISYSWDKETWVNSEELISRLTVSEKTTTPGKYTLYVKAKDNSGNESKVQTLEFEVTTIEEIKQPDIIFEDIPTVQVNGARYVKISSQMTTELLTDSMNKEALCGKTPEYINLTEDGKLRTGSEITINGKTKYIVVVNGDVNGDGKVTFLGDIVKANDCRIGIGELTTIQMLAADINNNGKIEFISDIVAMNDYRLGIINSL